MKVLEIETLPITLRREGAGHPYRYENIVPEGVASASLEGYAPIDDERAQAHLVTIRFKEGTE